MEVGVTIGLFPKTYVDDVDIVFVLRVTICWGLCEQAESYLCFKDAGWGILVKKLAIFLPIGCLKLTVDFWIKFLLNMLFTSILLFFVSVCKCCKRLLFFYFGCKTELVGQNGKTFFHEAFVYLICKIKHEEQLLKDILLLANHLVSRNLLHFIFTIREMGKDFSFYDTGKW